MRILYLQELASKSTGWDSGTEGVRLSSSLEQVYTHAEVEHDNACYRFLRRFGMNGCPVCFSPTISLTLSQVFCFCL